MYTIGQVSEMSGLPVSTLRYYDAQGLFPNIKRESGIRQFGDSELEALRIIECLKSSGMEIKDIKQFMQWCAEGPSTYGKRREMFERQRQVMQDELIRMNKVLDVINYKCWYYENSLREGSEDWFKAIDPDEMSDEIRRAYDDIHSANSKKKV